MKLHIDQTRPIVAFSDPHGSLEIIDDIIVSEEHRRQIKSATTILSDFIDLNQITKRLWFSALDNRAIIEPSKIICPGNGAWLIERLLRLNNINPNRSKIIPVNISRETWTEIKIDGHPSSITVLEDVVETGETASKIAKALSSYICRKHLVCAIWHDREYQTQEVLNSFDFYDSVTIGLRVYSKSELADIRSLSTLARKTRKEVKNLKYSFGKEDLFIDAMDKVLEDHSWVNELGKTLGYRLDE